MNLRTLRQTPWKLVISSAAVATLIVAICIEAGLKPYNLYPKDYGSDAMWWRFLPMVYALYRVIRAAFNPNQHVTDYWMVFGSLALSCGWIASFMLATVLHRVGLFPGAQMPDPDLVFGGGVAWAFCGAAWAGVVNARQNWAAKLSA